MRFPTATDYWCQTVCGVATRCPKQICECTASSAEQTELAEAAAKLAGSQGQHGGHRHLGKRYKGVPVKNFQKQTALANIGVAALVASESAASHAHHHKAKVHAVAPLPDASMINAASGTPTMQQV